MNISQCNHIRIRGNYEFSTDVEQLIKYLEKQYKIDIRLLPQWKQLIQLLHVSATDCKKRIQASKYRKTLIINSIYTENSRPSPFELTDNLVRTASTWKNQETRRRKQKKNIEENPEDIAPDSEGYDEISREFSESKFTAHPNTEIVPSEDHIQQGLKSEVETEVNVVEASHLPTNICINQHKLISPLGSNDNSISLISVFHETKVASEGERKEWLFLKPTSVIRSKIITLKNPTLKEQSINFSVLNCTTEYMHVRFKTVTEKGPFKKLRILPVTPLKIYPGISVTFKMIFKLCTREDFSPSSLYFKVGRNVLLDGPAEALLIPIESNFQRSRKVFVSKSVSITPAYSWHINLKIGFPTELVKISNDDKCNYHLRVIKRLYDFAKETDDTLASIDAIAPNTASIMQRINENEIESTSKIASSSKSENVKTVIEVESLKSIDVIALVVEEIVELALEPFVFKHIYLNVHPHSKRYIPVYFTKAEHTGFHQCYYDFEFSDPETEEIILTRPLRLYAEVLPHPVQVQPVILDMSNSTITHGYCEDCFVVTNTHKLYPVTAKVKLTTKMKKLFSVSPIETAIPANSSVSFKVRLCTGKATAIKTDDLAHFTFKIIFSGIECVYNNVPPFFYEIIAPCATDFKNIYSKKFYFEEPESSKQDLSKVNFDQLP